MANGRKSPAELLEHLSHAWFPVNLPLFRAVKSRLRAGEYKEKRSALIEDLKGDFSLFSYVLRKMEGYITAEDAVRSPIQLLKDLDDAALAAILDVGDDKISPHVISPDAKMQVHRVKHSLISCSTAESLALKANSDPDLVYSCAMVRQLGLNLVAWNYPRIYANAIGSINGPDSTAAARLLEENLTRVLGLSPTKLGIKAALGWNRSPDVLTGLGIVTEEEEEAATLEEGRANTTKTSGEEIAYFCQIGEKLARLSDPEHFPSTPQEWSSVVDDVQQQLGPKGILVIKKKLEQTSSGYSLLSPDAFRVEISQERNLKASNAQHAEKLFQENTFIKKCPDFLRQGFRLVYDHIYVGQISSEGIGLLVNAVIPSAGFTRGCVYLVDPKKGLLVPTLRIGDTTLSRFRPLSSADTKQLHPAVEALSYSTPVRQENVVVNGELVSHITGSFGNNERSGVLYLEMSPALRDQERLSSLNYFKAIRQCLNDCLNLS